MYTFGSSAKLSACSRHSVLPQFQRETFDAYEFCNSKVYVVASLSGILNIPSLAAGANDLVTVHAFLLVYVLLPQAGTFPVMHNQCFPAPYPIESSLFSKDCKLILWVCPPPHRISFAVPVYVHMSCRRKACFEKISVTFFQGRFKKIFYFSDTFMCILEFLLLFPHEEGSDMFLWCILCLPERSQPASAHTV